MKKLCLLAILGITFFQYAWCQNTEPGTQEQLNRPDSLQKTPDTDSVRYIPKRIGWTNDFVQLFSKEETDSLDALIDAYEKETTVEFCVATIDSSMVAPGDLEPYSLMMLRTWEVGKREKNNGILIVIAPSFRRIRIQNGYGIEKVLTNEQTKTILDQFFIPCFKEGKFYQGTKEGILAIISKLEKTGL